jgi:hypothetical protein
MLEQRKSTSTVVRYAYTESNGSERTGSDRFSGYGPNVGIGSKVDIRYTPGPGGRSRLAGHVPWLGLGLFAVGFLGMLGTCLQLWRQASSLPAARRRRRRRR